MTDKNYVVAISNNHIQDRKLLCYEPGCGFLFGFGDTSLADASFFTYDEALARYNAILEEKPAISSDGTIYPAPSLHRGLSISNAKPYAAGVLSILHVSLVPVANVVVEAQIKRPTGFTYD